MEGKSNAHQTKPASGPPETRALDKLPQILLTQVEAQQPPQPQQTPQTPQTPQAQSGGSGNTGAAQAGGSGGQNDGGA